MPGVSGLPQPMPQDTTPATYQDPSSSWQASGPPLSPYKSKSIKLTIKRNELENMRKMTVKLTF